MDSHEIYNVFLSVSRGMKNKPWKARKDFDGFDETKDGFICKRLELFFKKFPQISVAEYLKAPYLLYKDEDFFPLAFYTSQKAIAVYTAIQRKKKEELPDTSDQIADIKKSLKYIAQTCVNEGITLDQYCQKRTGNTYRPIVDYSRKLVNIYVLIRLPFFGEQLQSLSPQDKVLYLQEAYNNILKYKVRLNDSIRASNLVDEGLELIDKINKTKTTSKTTSNP